MTAQAWFTIALFLAVLIAAAYPLAIYVARIAEASTIRGVIGTVERFLYRLAGVDPQKDMSWTQYCCFSTRWVRSWSSRCSACNSGFP
jgi:potassium-transporting ATPase potassium-binding subunit